MQNFNYLDLHFAKVVFGQFHFCKVAHRFFWPDKIWEDWENHFWKKIHPKTCVRIKVEWLFLKNYYPSCFQNFSQKRLGLVFIVRTMNEQNYKWNKFIFSSIGLQKVELFGQSQNFLLFVLWLQPPKFYSKYSAFGFVLKMSCSEA